MSGNHETIRLNLTNPPASVHSLLPIIRVLSGSASGLIQRIDKELTLGRNDDCDVVLDDDGVSRHHARLSSVGREVWLEDLNSTNGTHLRDAPIEKGLVAEGDIFMVGPVLIKFGYLSLAEVDLAEKMYLGVKRDVTSGTFNRAGFLERLTQEIAISIRQKGGLSVVMAHVDNFHNVYDSGGLPTGQAVLRQVGQLLLSTCRLEDVIGRYDAENFAIILRNIDLQNACIMCERLRSIIEKTTFPINEAIELQLTVSLGVAGWAPGQTCEELVARAIAAMQQAEHARGNRVEIG